MKHKVPSIGYALIFLGTAIIFANDDTFNLIYLHYISIFAGLIILVIYYLLARNEQSLLCRLGLHKFEHIGWDARLNSHLFIDVRDVVIKKG